MLPSLRTAGFIPDFLYGPYWVVAAGPSSPGEAGFTGYEWAIVR